MFVFFSSFGESYFLFGSKYIYIFFFMEKLYHYNDVKCPYTSTLCSPYHSGTILLLQVVSCWYSLAY